MDTSNSQSTIPAPLAKAAQISSDVFSPLLVPTYGMIMAMWLTPLQMVAERSRLLATISIAFITCAIPAMVLFTLIRMRRVTDSSISNRTERFIPFCSAVLCYIAAAVYLHALHAPLWLSLFFLAAAVSALLALLINRRWKISAHGTALGCLTGMIGWMAACNLIPGASGMAWLTASLIVSGWVGTSRLILKRHTLAQVLAGLAMGLACAIGAECLLLI